MSQESTPTWITELLIDLTRLEITESKEGVSVEGAPLIAAANIGETPDSLNDLVKTDSFVSALSAVGSKSALFRNLDGTTGSPVLTPNSDTRKFKVFGWKLTSVDSFSYIPPTVSSSDFLPSVDIVDGDFDTFASSISDNSDQRESIIDFGSSAARPLLIKVKATDVIGSPASSVVTSRATASGGPFTQIDTRPLTTGLDEKFILPAGTAFRFIKCELVSVDSLAFTVTQDQFEITSPVSPTVTSSDWTGGEEAKMVDLDLSTFGRVTDTGTIVETKTILSFGSSLSRTPKAKIRANTTIGTSTDTFILGVSNSASGPFTVVASGVLTNNVPLTITGTVSTFQYMELIISSTNIAAFTVTHDTFQMWSTIPAVVNPTVIGGNLTGPLIVDGNPSTFESLIASSFSFTASTVVDFGSIASRVVNYKLDTDVISGLLNIGASTAILRVSNDNVNYTTIKTDTIPTTETSFVAPSATFRYAIVSMNARAIGSFVRVDYKNFQIQATEDVFTAGTVFISSTYSIPERLKIIDSDLNTFATRSAAGQGVIKTAVFDAGSIASRSILALIRMTHTIGSATNAFLLEKSDDNVSYTDITSGALTSGVIETIPVTPTSFRYVRLSIECAGITNFTVDDDIFEVLTYTNNTVFSSQFTNSANIVDGDLITFATSSVTNPTAGEEAVIDFGTSESRNLQAKVNVTATLGSATINAELLTADAVSGPFISRVTQILVDGDDTVVDAGTHTFQFAKLILTSTSGSTLQVLSKVFQVYDRNVLEPFNDSLVKIGTSDTQDGTLSATLWEQPLTPNQTVLMPNQWVTLLKNKYLTMQTTEHKTGAVITLDKIHSWDQNIAL